MKAAAAEAGVDIDVVTVDLATKARADGAGALYDVNPLGLVSVLEREGASPLTETAAILMWVQNAAPATSAFRRAPDDPDYYELLRWIAFCASELHKGLLRILLYDEANAATKDRFRALSASRFQLLDDHLRGRDHLLGAEFSAADAYLAWFLAFAPRAGLDLAPHPRLTAYRERVHARRETGRILAEDFPEIAAPA